METEKKSGNKIAFFDEVPNILVLFQFVVDLCQEPFITNGLQKQRKKRARGKEMESHRRLAVQLAAQLPENKEEALKTVESLRELVESWLYEKAPATILTLVTAAGTIA